MLATYGVADQQFQQLQRLDGRRQPVAGPAHLGFSVSGSSLDLTVGSGAVVNGTWSGSGGGSWGTAGDWQGGNVPGYVGDTATFGTAIGSTAATVTLDGDRGLSGLTLSTTGGGSYTLSRSGGDTASTLILANGGSTAPVSVTAAADDRRASCLLRQLGVSVSSGASLTVSGAVGDDGRASRSSSVGRHIDPRRQRHLQRRHDPVRRPAQPQQRLRPGHRDVDHLRRHDRQHQRHGDHPFHQQRENWNGNFRSPAPTTSISAPAPSP